MKRSFQNFSFDFYPEHNYSQNDETLLDLSFLNTKMLIELIWKKPLRGKVSHWNRQMLLILPLERKNNKQKGFEIFQNRRTVCCKSCRPLEKKGI